MTPINLDLFAESTTERSTVKISHSSNWRKLEITGWRYGAAQNAAGAMSLFPVNPSDPRVPGFELPDQLVGNLDLEIRVDEKVWVCGNADRLMVSSPVAGAVRMIIIYCRPSSKEELAKSFKIAPVASDWTNHTDQELAWEFAVSANEQLARDNPYNSFAQYFPVALELSKKLPALNSEAAMAEAIIELTPPVYKGSQSWSSSVSRIRQSATTLWKLWADMQNRARQPLPPHIEALQRAVSEGNLDAQLDLSIALVNGDDVPRNQHRARSGAIAAAEKGSGACARFVGQLYEQGIVERSLNDARSWFQKAADLGDPQGMFHYSITIVGNASAAAKWMEKSAEAGYERAQLDICLMYAKGDGVPRDMAKAKAWFKRCEAFAREWSPKGNTSAREVLKLFA